MSLSALVTVGTTQFPSLTNHIAKPATLQSLFALGITSLQIQHGTAPIILPPPSTSHPTLSAFPSTPNLSTYLANADIVIAHAGAGTITESVALQKRLLVVVNDTLMHNHQTELADAMARLGCCVVTSAGHLAEQFVEKVAQVLRLDVRQARPPERQRGAFALVLSQMLEG